MPFIVMQNKARLQSMHVELISHLLLTESHLIWHLLKMSTSAVPYGV